jgi:alanine dehydrogenase
MIIGVIKEIKIQEYRVGAPPYAVGTLTRAGHQVLVQKTAGEGSGFSDEEYLTAGATMVDTAEEVWQRAEMIYHVKEPLPSEYKYFRKGLTLFTYLHLAAAKELTLELLKSGINTVAFETVVTPDGKVPMLDPMSAVAGRIATMVGAQYLGRMYNGRGILMGGVPGTEPATVVILGGGVVGTHAAEMALGLGARVIMVTRNVARLTYLEEIFHGRGRFETRVSNPYTVAELVKEADLVVGAVMVAGARTPIMVSREMLKTMKPGAVIVDVAVDQGGCIETTRPTYHDQPVFEVDGIIHYCVANMPGMYPRTSAVALANATIPYALKLANLGLEGAMKDPVFRTGLNTYQGKLTCQEVADSLGLEYTPYEP